MKKNIFIALWVLLFFGCVKSPTKAPAFDLAVLPPECIIRSARHSEGRDSTVYVIEGASEGLVELLKRVPLRELRKDSVSGRFFQDNIIRRFGGEVANLDGAQFLQAPNDSGKLVYGIFMPAQNKVVILVELL